MTLTLFGSILVVLLAALAIFEVFLIYRAILVKTAKHKSERIMYEAITAYINEVLMYDE